MILIRFIFIFFFLFTSPIFANEDEILEIHKNKSLDQLVLQSEKKIEITQESNLEENAPSEIKDEIKQVGLSEQNDETSQLDKANDETINFKNSTNDIKESVTILKSQTLFDLDENIIKKHLNNIKDIKSKTLQQEFIKILSKPELDNGKNINNKIFYIIKKLYEIGEIGKAYKLIKTINIKNITDQQHLNYFYMIELNYLFSTFKLSEVCELKTFLLEESITLPKFLLEKTDIFCLTSENKFSEAKLLNSLLLDSESNSDKNFQDLFNYMILDESNDLIITPSTAQRSKELIFLYSAMLRINELALDEDFIKIDPLNLSIPVILSNSTKMDTRIKAANKAFYDGVISVDSLSALYQSVDFNSKEFSKPKKTILSLQNNNEMIMAFYYQLANIQIFPDDRLNVVLNYWEFAKKSGLEKIAYAITNNIIETFTPNFENTKYGFEISLAHISNKKYDEALKWINIYENSNTEYDKVEYVKFLISLNETNELGTITNYLSNNYKNIIHSKDQQTQETLQVLINFLDPEINYQLEFSYDSISDDRSMPSYFLIRDIEKNIKSKNDLSFFMLSLISINNKDWSQLHPKHLDLILNAYNLYDQGSLIKLIILEILNELNIF